MARRPKPWFWKARGAWYVTIGGERHPLGEDKSEAYDRFYALMRQPQQCKVRTDSLAAIVDAFLEWVSQNRSPETYEWYRYRLQRFIEHHPDLRAADLRPHHVETWVAGYQIGVNSRRNYLRSVKRCLKWATSQGYLDRSPIANLELPSQQRREVLFNQEEYETLLKYSRNAALTDLLTVTWETGCRPQESLQVGARHVDLENQRWVFSRTESKMKRIVRVVYLTDTALAITRRRMLAHPEGPLFRNSSGKPWTTDAVNCAFTAIQTRMGKDEMKRLGEEISEKNIAQKMRTLADTKVRNGRVVPKTKAELRCEAKNKLTKKRAAELAPRYSLYALRHSWATNALQRGVDPLTVAILMGHEDPSTLAKVYQHLSLNPKHLLEQARRAAG